MGKRDAIAVWVSANSTGNFHITVTGKFTLSVYADVQKLIQDENHLPSVPVITNIIWLEA